MCPDEIVIGEKVLYEGYKVAIVRDIQFDVAGFDVAVLIQNIYYKHFMWFEALALERY